MGLKGLKVANKIYNIIHQEHILLKNDSLESHVGIDFTCCKTNQATESVQDSGNYIFVSSRYQQYFSNESLIIGKSIYACKKWQKIPVNRYEAIKYMYVHLQ